METSINFKQKRDFGDIFNATFAFIKQEFNPLGKAFLYYVLPLLIIASILAVFISIEQQKYINSMLGDNPSSLGNPFGMMGKTFRYSFLLIIVYVFIMTSLVCTVYGYIKVYNVKGSGQVTNDDVWNEIKKYFFPVLGYSIVTGIITMIGAVFCILPGIYLGVCLSMVLMILMFEGIGLGDSISRSFYLIKENWWATFGIILVAYILVYLVSIVLSIPAMLFGFKSLFTSFKNIQETGMMNFSTTYFIVSSITNLLMYVLIIIPLITIAFQYFNLLEIKERPSLNDKIDQIG